MTRTLHTAATGMLAQQLYVDNIANNLANVNTTSFKRNKVEFQDLLYQTIRMAGSSNLQDTYIPTNLQVGNGVRPSSSQKIQSQGDLTYTNNPLDVAIDGIGFMQVTRPDGTLAYTRDGTLKVSENSVLVTSDGLPIEPQITIPQDATAISIGEDGFVQAEVFGQTQLQQLGQINLVKFLNPAGLKAVGQNLYEETFASGTPIIGQPTRDGFGRIMQGYLESSNVNVIDEMVNMITAQRAYEINSRAIQAGDDMMTTVNNMRR
jgi:flagellar basal-body rod protein FlgG